MFDDLSGKVALVTGASGGLGLHFARTLAAHGSHVIMGARRKSALAAAQADIVATGGKADIVDLDVTDAASVAAAVAALPRVDIVINNAGISIDGPALNVSEDDWDKVVDTNLKGVFLVAQAAARRMKEQGTGGAVVNIASILGHRVAGNLASYAASKAGVVHMSKALALEWARYGVRVNALCPGYFETDINRGFFATELGQMMIKRIPQRRLGQFEDLDGAMLLLASDAGRYITGASLAVDGGHLVSSL